jgi:hypothetical protein
MPTRRNSSPTALSSSTQISPVKSTSLDLKGGEKRCFARIWIPPIQTPIPVSTRPIRSIPPGPFPNIPPFRPIPPAPQPFLPKARFRSLSQARKAVRIALWINGEATGLLGGYSRTSEWVWEIFKVTIPGKPSPWQLRQMPGAPL